MIVAVRAANMNKRWNINEMKLLSSKRVEKYVHRKRSVSGASSFSKNAWYIKVKDEIDSIAINQLSAPLRKNAVSLFQISCKLLLPWKIPEQIGRRSVVLHS